MRYLWRFMYIEKSHDRVNRKKLFEVRRCYGVKIYNISDYEHLVRLIERYTMQYGEI